MPAKVKDIITLMEEYFPASLADDWDNVGLQLGSYDGPAGRILVTLDLDEEALDFALQQKIEMIITHHPLFFHGIKSIIYDQAQGKMLQRLIKADISVFSAHTNLDKAERGLNQILAERIGLQEIKLLDQNLSEALYKLVVYVPIGYEEKLRQVINEAGAGHLGEYANCSFRSLGIGTFTPLENSQPFIGTRNKLEEVQEYRLETIVPQAKVHRVVQKMKEAHPYEEVAYDLYRLENLGTSFSLGRVGILKEKISLENFCWQLKKSLGLSWLRVAGELNRPIHRVAVVCGAGASFVSRAAAIRCDVLVTGDLKYHTAQEAEALGVAVVDAGHQGTERIMVPYLKDFLQEACGSKGISAEVITFVAREKINNL